MELDGYQYFGVYPSTLFECFGGIHGMHFVFSLKHTSPEQTEEFLKVLHYCGADVSSNLKDISDYTAIIVDHNDKVDFEGPVFTLNYIRDCLKLVKLQDISNYRQEITKEIYVTSSCMSVVYFRSCTWDSVISKPNNKNVQRSKTSDCFEGENNQANLKGTDKIREYSEMSGCSDGEGNQVEPDGKEMDERRKSSKTTGCSDGEDNKVEPDMEETVERRKNSKISGCSDGEDNQVEPDMKEMDEIRETSKTSDCSDEEENQAEPDIKELDKIRKKSKNSDCSDEEDNQAKPVIKATKRVGKNTRMPYSYEEKCAILKYIIKHSEYSGIKGRQLWMVMERRKICPSRTWQSMKEHFLKKISTEFNIFTFITESDKKQFKNFL